MDEKIKNPTSQGDKVTIEKVLKSRGMISQDSHKSHTSKPKAAFDYLRKSETPMYSTENFRKTMSKDRKLNNQSYVAVDRRRFTNSTNKEEGKQMHNTSYGFPYKSAKQRFETDRPSYNKVDIEAYSDPDLQLRNNNILNVVSPPDKLGFHITDLLETNKPKKSKPVDLDMSQVIPDIRSGDLDNKILITPSGNRSFNVDNRYMIKNYRLINSSENDPLRPSKGMKPITAAPMSYNSSGARAIKKMTSGSTSRKERFNSTSYISRGIKSPSRLLINNSLLSADESGQYSDMRPVDNYFDKLYEETHYMFPKHKATIGPKTAYETTQRKTQSLSRGQQIKTIEESEAEHLAGQDSQKDFQTTDESVIKKLREKASEDRSGTLLVRQDRENRAEIDYLLQKSLKYHKEKQSKIGSPAEIMSDEDKLNIIMKTWLTKDANDPAYFMDHIENEARMTTHMVVNTRDNKSIYPEEIKDAEIDIYLRNRKNIPKYELLQYMKFSSNDTDEKTKESKTPKDDTIDDSDEGFEINVGCVNPLENSRLLLSFKLKVEFLDHVTPDFASPEHLPHSIFDDCSNELDRILEIMTDRKRKNDFLWAVSPYINEDGTMTDCKVKVLEYDFDRGEFLIEFDDKYKNKELYSYDFLQHQDLSKISKLTKYCCRSNLQMEYESTTEAAQRKDMVARRRTEAQNQLNCEKAFINELANKYDYIKMDKYMKENIKKKLLFDLSKFEPTSYVNNLCIQVETLYIFSILKSLLFTQFFDSSQGKYVNETHEWIKKMVSRYRIQKIAPPPSPYYALKSYELKGSPVEKMLSKEDARMILKQYSLLGRQ